MLLGRKVEKFTPFEKGHPRGVENSSIPKNNVNPGLINP
jgi:hypothetical protein